LGLSAGKARPRPWTRRAAASVGSRDDALVSTRTGILLVVSGLTLFCLLAVTYDREPLASVDTDVAKWVATDLPHVLELAARPFSWLGGWIGLTALGVAMTIVLVRERAWADVVFLAAALLGSDLAVSVLKNWFDRDRPAIGPSIPLPPSSSFPSGHAASGVAGLGALAVLTAERLPDRRARTWLWVAVVVAGVAVGLSRIALGVHYVTDVLAGWCFGLAWVAGCLLVRDRVTSRAS
jgi:membrane-associated phospholipid phosphatase